MAKDAAGYCCCSACPDYCSVDSAAVAEVALGCPADLEFVNDY